MKSLMERDHFILPDGSALKIRTVPACGEEHGVLVFAHGMIEHAGRYFDWGSEMARRGFTFLAVDHRGHGASDGERLWMNSLDDFVDDFERFTDAVVSEYAPRSIPVFIVGMSMGGGIAIRTAARFQKKGNSIAGLVLAAPALRVHPRVYPMLRPFASLFDFFFPRWHFLKGGTAGLCHDPKIIEAFQKDPLICSGRFPIHYGVENVRALEKNRQFASELSLPTLLVQGTGDLIISPEGASEFIDRLASPDKTLLLYPGLYHDILHEPEKEKINADIINWLNKHI